MKKIKLPLQETFEQLKDFGESTGKETLKAINQNFSPLKLIENIISSPKEFSRNQEKIEANKLSSHTPLNFEKLEKNYQEQDKIKLIEARQRLFQLVKKDEKEQIQKKKKEEQERLQKQMGEEYKKEEKQRKKIQFEQENIPKGKIRKSIFSPKKIVQRGNFEVKPIRGKN